ncbi:MAG TPA: hypothetical protein VEB19_05095 [Gemmatimonadaceae bacterium]|nr:hypothetical protein [Gemmatimonadaceae bacterium]
MTEQSGKNHTTFTETEVRSILARAAELETATGGGLVSAADLRKIAAEVGIDAGALEQAIAESRSQPATMKKRSDLLRVLTLKNLGLVVAGGVLGALAIAADGGGLGALTAVAIFGPSAAFAGWRALRHRKHGSVPALLRELGAFFGSFAMTIASLVGTEGFASAVAWGVICGLGAVAITNREDTDARITSASSQ